MKNIAIILLCLTCLSSTAYALKSPVGSRFDYRIKHIDYNPQDVVKMDAVIGIATHIVVKKGEEYVTHGGGITTTHANGAIEGFDRIATLIKNSEVGKTLDMPMIKHVLYSTVDVIIHMKARRVLQVFYDPIFKRKEMA